MAISQQDADGNWFTLSISDDGRVVSSPAPGPVGPAQTIPGISLQDSTGAWWSLSMGTGEYVGRVVTTPIPEPIGPSQTMPGMSGLDVITSAMRLLNIISSGELPSAAEANDGLMVLNQLIDSWNTERLMAYSIQRQVFPLKPGQQLYQMGFGSPDFNATRPSRIERAGIISLNNSNQPLELPIDLLTTSQWAEIPVKNISSALPLKLYDDGAFPYRGLHFWCVPSTPVLVALYSWSALQGFADLSTLVTFPPGYLKAIRYNLAVDLAAEFGAQVSQVVASIAVRSKAVLKSLNHTSAELKCDPALTGQGKPFNWITGS